MPKITDQTRNEQRKKLFEIRKKQIANITGGTFEKIIEQFAADLVGCRSGGSNERDHAREWLLFCFHQYFGTGDFEKDEQRLEELRMLLHSFSEPIDSELENI